MEQTIHELAADMNGTEWQRPGGIIHQQKSLALFSEIIDDEAKERRVKCLYVRKLLYAAKFVAAKWKQSPQLLQENSWQ